MHINAQVGQGETLHALRVDELPSVGRARGHDA